ncbi:MAG: fused MFS/spermidine synthase [Planctomycetota bacterium]|jgi:tetratricopeptide (TPR) repeat protein
MGKSRSFLPIVIPSMTVFLSSACIMILELVAGRLIARHVGSSLYTWTSVIGVVLAGITIGNYLGGRIADRFPAQKALAVLFAVSSVTCVAVVVLNNLVGDWEVLWYLKWPIRIFSHVCVVFLIPSTMLGTISPVVAKMALDRGLPTGRTVGDIYAWGAAGSIAGTFFAGFYLIEAMGTIAIIWTIGAALLLMAVFFWVRLWPLYLWGVLFGALATMGMAPGDRAQRAGVTLGLRKEPDPRVLYEDETQYNYVAVRQISPRPDKRNFVQDKLIHSKIAMDNITDLQYAYAEVYAAITQKLAQGKDRLSVLIIGGGGYVIPRYVEAVWPGSRVDVVEIDPGVTRAAMEAFGLDKDTTINTITMDARNYVDGLLEQRRIGRQPPRYEFIYEDAINHYSVPYQLVTKEFNDHIARILTDDGAYMANLIDIVDSGLFVGSFLNTLKQTFPYVYVVAKTVPSSKRNTFVVIGAKRQIDLRGLDEAEVVKAFDLWILSDSDLQRLIEKARGVVLTDNYAPVENLLAPVADESVVDVVVPQCRALAETLENQGKLDQSIAVYKELVKVWPDISLYRKMAGMIMRRDRNDLQGAAQVLRQGLEVGKKARMRAGLAAVHLDLALVLKELNRPEQSRDHFLRAIEGFQRQLTKKPESVEAVAGLGIALTEVGKVSDGIRYLRQAVTMAPADVDKRLTLAEALAAQQRYDQAIELLKEGISFALNEGRRQDAAGLNALLEVVLSEKAKSKQ